TVLANIGAHVLANDRFLVHAADPHPGHAPPPAHGGRPPARGRARGHGSGLDVHRRARALGRGHADAHRAPDAPAPPDRRAPRAASPRAQRALFLGPPSVDVGRVHRHPEPVGQLHLHEWRDPGRVTAGEVPGMGPRLRPDARARAPRPQRPRAGVPGASRSIPAGGAGPRLPARGRAGSRAYGVRTIFVASRASNIRYASSAWSSFIRWLMILSGCSFPAAMRSSSGRMYAWTLHQPARKVRDFSHIRRNGKSPSTELGTPTIEIVPPPRTQWMAVSTADISPTASMLESAPIPPVASSIASTGCRSRALIGMPPSSCATS